MGLFRATVTSGSAAPPLPLDHAIEKMLQRALAPPPWWSAYLPQVAVMASFYSRQTHEEIRTLLMLTVPLDRVARRTTATHGLAHQLEQRRLQAAPETMALAVLPQ